MSTTFHAMLLCLSIGLSYTTASTNCSAGYISLHYQDSALFPARCIRISGKNNLVTGNTFNQATSCRALSSDLGRGQPYSLDQNHLSEQKFYVALYQGVNYLHYVGATSAWVRLDDTILSSRTALFVTGQDTFWEKLKCLWVNCNCYQLHVQGSVNRQSCYKHSRFLCEFKPDTQ